MIKVKNLSFTYPKGSFSLNIPLLEIGTARHVALVGPSGSGKSTLLNLIAGVLRPRRGTVYIDGQKIHNLPEESRRAFRLEKIGMVFQSFALMPFLTVRENITLPLRLRRRAIDAVINDRCDHLLQTVGLTGLDRRHPNQLSQGEQQRVAICRALISDPRLVIADEPTGNLDHDNTESILKLMIDQIKASGASLIMSTHNRSLDSAFDEVLDINTLRGPSE